MNQDDSSPASPRWPASAPTPKGPGPLVGGLPWADGDGSTGASGSAPALGGSLLGGRLPTPGGRRGGATSPRAERARSPVSLSEAAADVAADAIRGLRDQLAAALREMPAWSISLAAHCLLLLLLALWVIRERPAKKLALSLAFGTAAADARETGVDIGPPREVVVLPEENRTEIANSTKPPAQDPNAAPPPVPEAPTDSPAAAEPRAKPAVGMLLSGREAGSKRVLLGAAGGNDASEAAVAAALDWLKRQQGQKDGLWSLGGPYSDGCPDGIENQLAATAMALLAFQGAGHTTTEGEHQAVVARGWRRLLKAQEADGSFYLGTLPYLHALYSHAQATIALCELYGMTGDHRYREPAERAVAYCVRAQGAEGGWKYVPGQDGDMSVTGWYMMALKSAEMAGISVPPEVFQRLEAFVDSVAVDNGVRYGYMRPVPTKPVGGVTEAVTAEGLLCRQYLGWTRNEPRLVEGVKRLLSETKVDFQDHKNVYAWYYITQVAHNMEGDLWSRWNARLLETLPAAQVKTGRERGSWDPSLDRWGHVGGRLFVTCFCTYMLEVYYRHLPLYGAQTPPPH